MTWALCLNCGDVNPVSDRPCPGCNVASTGEKNLDIAFSTLRIGKGSLKMLGLVIKAIHGACDDGDLCFWTFIHYVSLNHPSVLEVCLRPEFQNRAEALLAGITIPQFTLVESSASGDAGPAADD